VAPPHRVNVERSLAPTPPNAPPRARPLPPPRSEGESYVVPEKSYKNQSYMASHEAKPLRILAEFLEPEQRFRACGVDRTILFFGSARARSHADHTAAVARAEAAVADPAAAPEERRRQAAALDRLRRSAWMCDVYEDVASLARRLTEWSMARIPTGPSSPGGGGAGGAARPHGVASWPPNYVVCTGGGPGLMEAANRGAAEVPGAITAGVAISLPFEAGLNKYVTPELAFTQHYFFSRKHALCYPARALVACPGGFGTADELFEVLTLLQSGKSACPGGGGGGGGGTRRAGLIRQRRRRRRRRQVLRRLSRLTQHRALSSLRHHYPPSLRRS
jgi:predicted Rossmann-fold nucleotide-binding protein